MKKWLPRLSLVVLTTLALLTSACKKTDEQPLTNAVIVNDPRTCPCCGGAVLNVKDTPKFTGNGTYAISNYIDLAIDPNELPLSVRVDYTVETGNGTSCRPTARVHTLERR
jgi:hypothetical protein